MQIQEIINSISSGGGSDDVYRRALLNLARHVAMMPHWIVSQDISPSYKACQITAVEPQPSTSLRIDCLEFRECDRDFGHPAEIVMWEKDSHKTVGVPCCFAIATWVKTISGYQFGFVGRRPLEHVLSGVDFFRLIQHGQWVMDKRFYAETPTAKEVGA